MAQAFSDALLRFFAEADLAAEGDVQSNFTCNMNLFPEHEVEELVESKVTDEKHELVVFNDEVNTFDHVIDTLIDVCDHSPEQAEQCTLIIHHNGKCSVKLGQFDVLAGMRKHICDRGISAEVY